MQCLEHSCLPSSLTCMEMPLLCFQGPFQCVFLPQHGPTESNHKAGATLPTIQSMQEGTKSHMRFFSFVFSTFRRCLFVLGLTTGPGSRSCVMKDNQIIFPLALSCPLQLRTHPVTGMEKTPSWNFLCVWGFSKGLVPMCSNGGSWFKTYGEFNSIQRTNPTNPHISCSVASFLWSRKTHDRKIFPIKDKPA